MADGERLAQARDPWASSISSSKEPRRASSFQTGCLPKCTQLFSAMWSCPGSVDSFSSLFLDLVSINLTPQAQSAAAGGRSSGDFFFGPPKIDRV